MYLPVELATARRRQALLHLIGQLLSRIEALGAHFPAFFRNSFSGSWLRYANSPGTSRVIRLLGKTRNAARLNEILNLVYHFGYLFR